MPEKPRFNRYPFWAPRFWAGMTLPVFWRLAARNRFRIHPLRMPMAGIIASFGVVNSLLAAWQKRRYGKRIADTEIQPPIFILGHWRSGTTYLHELLSLDERFVTPTTFQVYNPHHFLITERLVTRWFPFIIPSRRPMDNMAVGLSSPQEDEWALCNLGTPSPYLRVAFPDEPAPFLEYFNLEGVAEPDLERWKESLRSFFAAVVCRGGERLVLKSPGHTGRIRHLLSLFPEAKFIHIVRNPYIVFPSTMRMWESFDRTQGFQLFHGKGLAEFVLEAHERIYEGFERDRGLLEPNQLFEMRYEDFVRTPVEHMRRLYDQLGLGGFDEALPKIEAHVAGQKDYKTNRFELTPEIESLVSTRWGKQIERYGYSASFSPEATATSSEGNQSEKCKVKSAE
jgi:hypothetical protein